MQNFRNIKVHKTYWDNLLAEVLGKQKLTAEQSATTQQPKKQLKRRYNLGEKFEGVYLTQREAECMAFLLQGKKYKTIADRLNLSLRTIEAYIRNVRIKLDCNKIAELIEIIFDTDFPVIAADLSKRLSTINQEEA